MNVQASLQTLNLTADTDIANAASVFTDYVKKHIGEAAQDTAEENIPAQEKTLTSMYENFFKYAQDWAVQERKRYEKQKNHADAARLKQSAAEALNDLQDNIIKFAQCYLYISRSMNIVHNEIRKHEKKSNTEKKDFKWTSDTGMILRRYKKERQELAESTRKMAAGLQSLEGIDQDISAFEQAVQKIHGARDAEKQFRSLRSALRTLDFEKAGRVLANLASPKKKFTLGKKADEGDISILQNSGQTYFKTLQDNQGNLLMPDGKLFLKANEVNVLIKAQEREIEQKDKYIEKYHQPYMESKLKTLYHLREKLLVVGSLDGLITLYMRLMRGLAQPLEEVKFVREYESQVIENVQYLLSGQFQEVANIHRWAVEALHEFYESMESYERRDGD